MPVSQSGVVLDMCPSQRMLLLLYFNHCMHLGLATLPSLPEAIQLLQLDSINDLKETIRNQESAHSVLAANI